MAIHLKSTIGALNLNKFIYNEAPLGIINSINILFTLLNTPVIGTVRIYLNGSLQQEGSALDYTISGKNITFLKAPHTNSEILVHYIKQ